MSEVRMSLQEYDALKEKMDRQERIIKAILTPNPIDGWDIQYHQTNPNHPLYTSSRPMENLTYEDKKYIESMIYKNASVLAEEQFAKNDMALMFHVSTSFQLGYFTQIEEPKMAEEVE